MNQEIVPQQELLSVRCVGEFSLPEAKDQFLVIMKAVVELQKRKVLVDVRELAGRPTTWERFSYSTFIAETVLRTAKGACPAIRWAYVGEIPLIDPERFGETVARNRGLDVKVYLTPKMKEACAWLEVPPPDWVLDWDE